MNEIEAAVEQPAADETTAADLGETGIDESGEAAPTAASATDETALARDLILKAHPDVVPELIRGETLAEMLACVPDARAAYARVAEATRAASAPPAAERIPAGGVVRTASINPDILSPMAKIRFGLDHNA